MFPVRKIFLLLSNIAQTPKKENLIHDALSMMLAPDVAIMSKIPGLKPWHTASIKTTQFQVVREN